MNNLCLAGGVALNCVANGKVLRDGAFDDIWIQPAAGDAGGALGAALAAYHQHEKLPRAPTNGRDGMRAPISARASSRPRSSGGWPPPARSSPFAQDDAVVDSAAQALADGKAVGWFQGRMEFGPRALGARSISATRARPTMQKTLN